MEIFVVDTKKILSRQDTTKIWQNVLEDILKSKFPKIVPVVKRDKMGKPFVANIPGCYFSVSHSKRKIAVAVDVMPVGVDIEKVREVNLDIVHHFFSNYDIEKFCEIPAEDKLDSFFDMWTKKESYVKCIGMGFSKMPFRSFTITNDGLMGDDCGRYSFSTYDIVDGYKMSVCKTSDTDIRIYQSSF